MSNQVHSNRAILPTFTKLCRILSGEYKLILVSVVLMLIASFATLAGPRIIAYIIDEVLTPKKTDLLLTALLVYASCEIIRISASVGHMYFFSVAGQRAMQILRMQLYQRFLQLPASYFDKNPSGQIVTRMTNDISVIGQLFTAGVVLIFEKTVTVAFIVVGLFLLNVKLAVISLSLFLVFFIFAIFFSRWMHRLYRTLYAQLERFNTQLAEMLFNMNVIHLFTAEDLHHKEFESVNDSLARSQRNSRLSFAVLHPFVTIVTGLSMASIIWFGGNMVLQGEIQLGVLVACFSYILWLMWPLIHIIEKWNVFLAGLSASERVFECFTWDIEEDLEALDSPPKSGISFNGEIIFENISFAYDKETWALRNFSLKINPGEKVGVVGPSGSGKTTLLALLRRFYEPQEGRILIDGKDIRSIDKRALRQSLGLVQQDLFLFQGTVSENINLWDSKDQSIHDMSSGLLPVGFDVEKNISERGANLSVGEKQSVSFLRCLANKPSIWLLDEASANLDQSSERRMFELLKLNAANRTILSIAHRISTVRDADRIIVLHKGHLVEEGSHGELLAQNGFYARLLNLESRASTIQNNNT